MDVTPPPPLARSSTRTSAPASRASIAAQAPAQPRPTITTSACSPHFATWLASMTPYCVLLIASSLPVVPCPRACRPDAVRSIDPPGWEVGARSSRFGARIQDRSERDTGARAHGSLPGSAWDRETDRSATVEHVAATAHADATGSGLDDDLALGCRAAQPLERPGQGL